MFSTADFGRAKHSQLRDNGAETLCAFWCEERFQESSAEGCLVRALAKDLSPSPRLAVESAEGLHRVLYRISLKTVFSSEGRC